MPPTARFSHPPARPPERALSGVPARGAPHALLRRAVRRLAGALRVLRTVIGAPDYERYVAHCRARGGGEAGGAGAPVLDRAAFERERLAARYNRPGSRCC